LDVITETASGGAQNGADFAWEHRPVLLDLIERAQAGEYDVLLVTRLDRLSRDHATLVVLERRLERHGVRVVSVAEGRVGAGVEVTRGA
jgi:DNA invertase Pin-like site-specific DNA recombinase